MLNKGTVMAHVIRLGDAAAVVDRPQRRQRLLEAIHEEVRRQVERQRQEPHQPHPQRRERVVVLGHDRPELGHEFLHHEQAAMIRLLAGRKRFVASQEEADATRSWRDKLLLRESQQSQHHCA